MKVLALALASVLTAGTASAACPDMVAEQQQPAQTTGQTPAPLPPVRVGS